MAIATSLNFTTCFNFKVDPKKFNLSDTTNYALESILLTDVRGLYKITDPTGTVVYENAGFATDDFSSPDVDANISLDFDTVSLPLDSNGDVIKGNYTIDYKIDVAGAQQPGIYTKQSVYAYSFTTPCLKLDLSFDCEDATVTSVDVTDYGPLLTTKTLTHTLTPPTGADVSLTPTITFVSTVVASPISTKTWTAELASDVVFTTSDGLILKYLLEGTAEIVVDCGVATCDLARCLFELKAIYDNLKCTNSTKAAQALKDLQLATLTYELYRAALGCGNIEQAEVYRKEIFSCACDAGCSSCTGCNDDCTGCEVCNDLPVLINPGSISIQAGPQGIQGIQGTQGSQWYVGTGVPLVGLGVNNDMFLDDATGDVYQKQGGAWVLVDNIKGTAGTNGTNGTTFEHYATAPVSVTWVNGSPTTVVNHILTGATGDYEIHADVLSDFAIGAIGDIRIVVDSVIVLTWGNITAPGANRVDTDSLLWRGSITNGDLIEITVQKNNAQAVTTNRYSWLINKSQ